MGAVSRTILIVDDDPSSRRLMAATLEGVAGYRLREAADGEEAVRAAIDTRPDIVLLDVNLPGLDGVGACRRLRSDPATADATIVMLTANGGRRTERSVRAAGADVLLTKPFSPLHLLRLVDRIGARG